ncbi:SPS1, Serine/threonine protein kinase [Curvularia clavata]|uniref:SPS1, Serine/threonine protein kinase n=1 Tax=Curvularia clavata TaxID=95742 RepID=A0A9Q9DXT5_CURCL|nr:SPS1, Serine/threonine protein kinase [Curvularia clavata]
MNQLNPSYTLYIINLKRSQTNSLYYYFFNFVNDSNTSHNSVHYPISCSFNTMVRTRSMRSNPEKRRASDELVSLPPAKRAKKNSASIPNPKLSSPPPRAQNQPVHYSSPTSAASPASESSVESDTDNEDAYDADVEAYTDDEETDDEVTEFSDAEDTEADQLLDYLLDHLLDRIRLGVAYMERQQALCERIMQNTRFQIDTTDESTREALTLLCSYGTLVASAPFFELFEIGIPRPDWVAEGDLPGIHDPQWWVGKSQAEIKAGPHADEADVRRAAGHLKGLKTRQSKKRGLTAREKENKWKLNAAMRSQERSSRVEHHDEDDEEEDETESEVDGGEYVPSS